MAKLDKEAIRAALSRLGALAVSRGLSIDLVAVGGTVMVLEFEARDSTQDVDAVVLWPEAREVRDLARLVAHEQGFAEDWLNDAVKGYVGLPSPGPTIFSAAGILVRRPSLPQLLALKLSAWRDDVDIADARRILAELPGTKEAIWSLVSPFLVKGRELKASYAYEDLWEEREHVD